METVISYTVIAIIGYTIGEWNSRRRSNRYEKFNNEYEDYAPRIEILVQGLNQDIIEFNASLRKYQKEHLWNPILDTMVCAQDGRLTVAFTWEEPVSEEK